MLGNQVSGDAKLNIQGTEWLLVVMPEVPRTRGKVLAYLVPTASSRRYCKENTSSVAGHESQHEGQQPDLESVVQ